MGVLSHCARFDADEADEESEIKSAGNYVKRLSTIINGPGFDLATSQQNDTRSVQGKRGAEQEAEQKAEQEAEQKALKAVGEACNLMKNLYGLTYVRQVFDIQIPLALVWAMKSGHVDQVDLIIQKSGIDIVWFLYGKPADIDDADGNDASSERPIGTPGKYYNGYMLAQLYDYRDNDVLDEFLEPILHFNSDAKKDAKKFLGNDKAQASHQMKKVWDLQKALLEKDEDAKDSTRKLDEMWNAASIIRADSNRAGLEELVAYQELTLWAVIMQRYDMARLFWKLGGHAIPNALLASMMSQQLAKHPKLSSGKFATVVETYERNTKQFERCAIDVLNRCYVADSDKTQSALEAKMTSYTWLVTGTESYTCLSLAKESGSQRFIGQAACQAVIERSWVGDAPPVPASDLMGRVSRKDPDDPSSWRARCCRFPAAVGGCIKSASLASLNPNTWQVSPRTKYLLEFASYFVLVMTYSTFCMMKLEEKLTNLEWALCVWFFGLVFEEARQTVEDGVTKKAVRDWFEDKYNRIDLFMYACFFTAFGFRYKAENDDTMLALHYQGTANLQRVAKGMHGFTLMVVWFRLLSYLKTHPDLGPKIRIFEELFFVLVQFLVLLLIFIISYGIFVQTIAAPFAPSTTAQDWGVILMRVLYRPYFQMYGELMLEDLADQSSCNAPGHPWVSCGHSIDYAVPVITAVYLIITSIMLLNMLIAAFTTKYEAIEAKALAYYREEKLNLLDDYQDRLAIPAPFNMPVIFANFGVFLVDKARCTTQKKELPPALSENDKAIEAFQDDIADRYAEEPPTLDEDESMDVKIKDMNTTIMQKIADLEKKEEAHFCFLKGHALSQGIRFENTDALKDVALGVSDPAFDDYSRNSGINLVAFRTESMEQQIAKSACPPRKDEDSNVDQIPSVFSNPASKRQKNAINFPTSHGGQPYKSDRLRLPLQGENRMLMHFVTRWKRDRDGIRMERDGKCVLEFIAVKRHKEDEQWAIPEIMYEVSGHLDTGDVEYKNDDVDPPSPVAKYVFNVNNLRPGLSEANQAMILKKLDVYFNDEEKGDDVDLLDEGGQEGGNPDTLAPSKTTFGFMDDERNTDNAWVSVKIEWFHDDDDLFDAFEFVDVKAGGTISFYPCLLLLRFAPRARSGITALVARLTWRPPLPPPRGLLCINYSSSPCLHLEKTIRLWMA